MTLNFENVDKNRVAVYKKGSEPSDVLFWLTRSPYERIKTLELICQEYTQKKSVSICPIRSSIVSPFYSVNE